MQSHCCRPHLSCDGIAQQLDHGSPQIPSSLTFISIDVYLAKSAQEKQNLRTVWGYPIAYLTCRFASSPNY